MTVALLAVLMLYKAIYFRASDALSRHYKFISFDIQEILIFLKKHIDLCISQRLAYIQQLLEAVI